MRTVIQRVSEARVEVEGRVVGAVGPGLCVFVGVTHDDTPEVAVRAAEKVWNLRVMEGDERGRERSVAETTKQVLVVSQFTLYGDTRKGRRPSWQAAAPPDQAEPLVEELVTALRRLGATVATGRFGAHMHVHLVNDGPVTLWIEV